MYGLTPHHQQLLRAFITELFEELPRADQRRWAGAYLEGLLTTPGKKTLRRMADTLGASSTASQSLHQFVNASPWQWGPVRDRLAQWVGQRSTPDSLVLDMAYIRKRGNQSCGVHTRYIPGEGVGSCQLALAAMLAGRDHIAPVDWDLHLPGRWLEDPAARTRTRIPDALVPRSAGRQALDLVDAQDPRLTAALPVVGNFSCADGITSLVMGLTRRSREFVLAVPATMLVRTERGNAVPAGQMWGPSRPQYPDHSDRPHGWPTPPAMATAMVRLPLTHATGPECQLMTVRPSNGSRTPQLWLSNVHDRRRMYVLAGRLDDSARLIEVLADRFGLADFEGRSYPGWHHYTTLVSAAYAWSQVSHTYEPA
ncbi:IS701 family transposase [Streptomyces sp. NBC_00859]|uniref:IS701 family transposase n=1 Tax=Streptomyces sp. NBC_00859 TaxID=2903682 RepID=UPI00386849FF|nr:transposase [Streptomyces sp. NBC_00859]